jgi:hypothetical protein
MLASKTDQSCQSRGILVLSSGPEPWPFPPQLRVVTGVAAAVDLVDWSALDLVELGRARLVELTSVAATLTAPTSGFGG